MELGLIKVCADPHCEAVYHNAPSKPCHCEFCGIPLKRINEDTYWKNFLTIGSNMILKQANISDRKSQLCNCR